MEPVRRTDADLRGGKGAVAGGDTGRGGCGLDFEQAIREWLEFAKRAGHLRVTGKRRFASDLELVDTMEAEAESLYQFARAVPLNLSASLGEIIERTLPMRAGNEHRVYRARVAGEHRVIKVTHAGKYGRNEHTPYLYLLRWKLLNAFAPSIDARLEDCIRNERKELSMVVSMSYFLGGHPSPRDADEFVRSLSLKTVPMTILGISIFTGCRVAGADRRAATSLRLHARGQRGPGSAWLVSAKVPRYPS